MLVSRKGLERAAAGRCGAAESTAANLRRGGAVYVTTRWPSVPSLWGHVRPSGGYERFNEDLGARNHRQVEVVRAHMPTPGKGL